MAALSGAIYMPNRHEAGLGGALTRMTLAKTGQPSIQRLAGSVGSQPLRPRARRWSLAVLAHDQHGVAASEGKRIAHQHSQVPLPRAAGDVIEIAFRVRYAAINGRWQQTVVEGLNAAD